MRAPHPRVVLTPLGPVVTDPSGFASAPVDQPFSAMSASTAARVRTGTPVPPLCV
ncbi:hypothetical protein LV75_002384 [Actinokineospora diospyrosa]|uniref:Uncharacterized protein n=1 Tax=Actinokineospora diospyrosa TaxID=103728 RepID=A0ABT1IB86_9PSEU|nr:hypothetical protein [Actinokineospora diospyrosa]